MKELVVLGFASRELTRRPVPWWSVHDGSTSAIDIRALRRASRKGCDDCVGWGRFLALARDGVVDPNLVWKDTVLVRTGQTVEFCSTSPSRDCGWRTATSPST